MCFLQCRNRPSTAFALKCLKKQHIVETQQQEHVFSEKNILMSCKHNFITRSVTNIIQHNHDHHHLVCCIHGWYVYIVKCQLLKYLSAFLLFSREIPPEFLFPPTKEQISSFFWFLSTGSGTSPGLLLQLTQPSSASVTLTILLRTPSPIPACKPLPIVQTTKPNLSKTNQNKPGFYEGANANGSRFPLSQRESKCGLKLAAL